MACSGSYSARFGSVRTGHRVVRVRYRHETARFHWFLLSFSMDLHKSVQHVVLPKRHIHVAGNRQQGDVGLVDSVRQPDPYSADGLTELSP
jgi:hypothetical protein